MLIVWVSVFIVYQTTFISTPRLFMYPKVGPSFFDTQDHAAALRGKPNDTDMRKHLLYYPLGHAIFKIANGARLLTGFKSECTALIFPDALYGSLFVVLAYFLFLRQIGKRREVAVSTAVYAFSYSLWLVSSLTESYALTTLCINIFLCFAIRKDAKPSWTWCSGMVVLIGLSSLCDLRSLFLLVVPLYIVIRSPGIGFRTAGGYALFLCLGAMGIVAAAYTSYEHMSGRTCFNIVTASNWFLGYGHKFISGLTLGSRSPCYTLFTFLIQALSPLYQEQLNQASLLMTRVHVVLASCFMGLYIILVIRSVPSLWRNLLARRSLQGMACWVAIYLAYHIFYSPWSAMLFAPPVILPLMLLIVPGVIKAWEPLRFGTKIMAVAAVTLLANNLMLMNEARLAWQCPSIVQSPADCIYLLPGEIERARFLMAKISLLYPSSERSRLIALMAKAPQTLSAKEELELNELFSKRPERLTQSEREQLHNITYRQQEAVNLARKGM